MSIRVTLAPMFQSANDAGTLAAAFGTTGVDAAPAFRPIFESVLLKSRRPILLAPSKISEHVCHNAAIAWNGTTEAASALTGAIPFLESARWPFTC